MVAKEEEEEEIISETGFFVDDDDDNGNCSTVLEGVYESRGRGCNNYWKIAR